MEHHQIGEVMVKMTVKAMARFMLVVGFTVAAMALSVYAAASPSPPQQGGNTNFTLEGKINNLSPGRITVSTNDNMIFHVSFDSKTEIHRKDGAAGSAKDLAVGETIKAQGDLTPAGIIQARRIDIE